jgi:tRNA(Ile)-lysidine synthase
MMINSVAKTIELHNMLEQGDTVYVGLSGGADSVCLLLCLLELSDKYSAQIKAVHINHQLRGQESDADEEFCQKLCKRLNVPFVSERVDVKGYAQKGKLSCEEAARELRYNVFYALECDKIATAHNLNDNAETVLFNLTRGTGLKGLCGIPPVRGKIIRPLIGTSRTEIEDFLKEKGQAFVTDSTNLNDEFSRNKIRHNVIPELLKINSGFLDSISSMTEILAIENSFLDECAYGITDGYILDKHAAVRRRYIKKLLESNNLEISADRIKALDSIVLHGGKINLSGNVYAFCRNGILIIETADNKLPDAEFSAPAHIGENCFIGDKIVTITEKNCDYGDLKSIINNNLTINCIDCGKIQGDIVLRNRRDGDRIQLCGNTFHSRLKKLLNRDVPLKERSFVAVLSDDNGIIWAEGYGADERVRADNSSQKIYEIRIRKNEQSHR